MCSATEGEQVVWQQCEEWKRSIRGCYHHYTLRPQRKTGEGIQHDLGDEAEERDDKGNGHCGAQLSLTSVVSIGGTYDDFSTSSTGFCHRCT